MKLIFYRAGEQCCWSNLFIRIPIYRSSFISFREQTIARKWGWDDGVTNWAGRPRGNQLRSREEDDDCHGPAALQAIVLALAADESEQFRKQPESVLGHAASQASRAAVCQKSSSTHRLYRWEPVRTHYESHRESMRQGTLLTRVLLKKKKKKKFLYAFFESSRQMQDEFPSCAGTFRTNR